MLLGVNGERSFVEMEATREHIRGVRKMTIRQVAEQATGVDTLYEV
jgi:hypothetical protein